MYVTHRLLDWGGDPHCDDNCDGVSPLDLAEETATGKVLNFMERCADETEEEAEERASKDAARRDMKVAHERQEMRSRATATLPAPHHGSPNDAAGDAEPIQHNKGTLWTDVLGIQAIQAAARGRRVRGYSIPAISATDVQANVLAHVTHPEFEHQTLPVDHPNHPTKTMGPLEIQRYNANRAARRTRQAAHKQSSLRYWNTDELDTFPVPHSDTPEGELPWYEYKPLQVPYP